MYKNINTNTNTSESLEKRNETIPTQKTHSQRLKSSSHTFLHYQQKM